MAISTRLPNVTIENANLRFRNFGGKPDAFNRDGAPPNFSVDIDPENVEAMLADGWNIKHTKVMDPDDDPTPFVKVRVNFDGPYPPMIKVITSGRYQIYTKELMGLLDGLEFENVDLVISPSRRPDGNGEGRVVAYLKKMIVTVQEDELDRKYEHIPPRHHQED